MFKSTNDSLIQCMCVSIRYNSKELSVLLKGPLGFKTEERIPER